MHDTGQLFTRQLYADKRPPDEKPNGNHTTIASDSAFVPCSSIFRNSIVRLYFELTAFSLLLGSVCKIKKMFLPPICLSGSKC